MTYADLIEILKPHAEENVFITGLDKVLTTEVTFCFKDNSIVQLTRRWGKDEIEIKIKIEQE